MICGYGLISPTTSHATRSCSMLIDCCLTCINCDEDKLLGKLGQKEGGRQQSDQSYSGAAFFVCSQMGRRRQWCWSSLVEMGKSCFGRIQDWSGLFPHLSLLCWWLRMGFLKKRDFPLNFAIIAISVHLGKMTGCPGQTRPLMWINMSSSWEKICKLIFFQIPVGIWWHWVSRGHYLLVLGGNGTVLGGTDWYLIVLGR